MSKILLFFVIFPKILIAIQASKRCGFGECNHEGECYEDENTKSCTCFGTKYFMGPKCSQVVDNCQNENPCQNGGKCKNIVGQFICEDCNTGFGGLSCNLEISNSFEKMLLYFNHYAFYGQTHKFIIMVETLGAIPFSLEFISDNYAIDSFQTIPDATNKWIYSQDLAKEIKKLGIRYHQDLPYLKGYYYVASEKFWTVGFLDLNLHSYDSESATKLLYQNQFKLFLLTSRDECVPNLSFIYGTSPLDPLMLDIASYNNFEVVLKNRCFDNSKIVYHWIVYNMIGTQKLHDFGSTNELLLKIRPFKFWFNYHDEVMSTYCLVVRMVEEYRGNQKETQTRCFIFVLPKPVSANIKGGSYREIGIKQNLILDASNSRDYALAPDVCQDMFFKWNCVSENDAGNAYCKDNMGSSSTMKIKAGKLQIDKSYNFKLTIRSKVNELITDETHQIVKIMENVQLNIDVKCLRNCKRNEFIQDDLLHLKAEPLVGQLSKTATFKWTLKDQVIGEKVDLIYLTKKNEEVLDIQVMVQDQTLSAKAIQDFKLNLPPVNGSCSIEPKTGDAFLTDFYIKCENYFDKDTPLNYEYLEENGFPLQRANDAKIHTKLPPCNKVIVRICDPFQACTENNLKVTVNELQEIEDLNKFISEQEGGLKNLLKTGDILAAMICLKSLIQFIKTVEDLAVVIQEIKEFNFKTLLQVEQFLDISSHLVSNNLPLSAEKAKVFNQYFVKLQQGFMTCVKDDEIRTFKRLPYEKSCQELLGIMQLFSQTWQNIAAVQIPVTPTILASNPLIEIYPELNDFDIEIAIQLEHWLYQSKSIQDCLALINFGAKELYAPWENIFSNNKNNLNLQMYAFDNKTQQDIKLNEINIILDEACVRELQRIWHNQNILIQAVSFGSNPFWWYPSETPLNSEVFFVTAFGSGAQEQVKYFKNPFEFQLKLKANNLTDNVVVAIIKNNLHMPLYTINLPANAVLLITFLSAEKPLNFLVNINKIPKSFEVSKSAYRIENINENQTFIFMNTFNKYTQAYMAVLLDKQVENVTFSFMAEIKECLYWDFSLKPPQWSSQGCKPKLEISNNDSLTCFCHHFSTFTARNYPSPIQETLKEQWLLKELPLNWYLIGFYLILITVFAIILLHNFDQHKKQITFLPIKSSGHTNNDIEVCIFTGSQLNATSTGNITLRLISHKGPFSLTINQDPFHPFLKKNSKCRLLVSSQAVDIPLKLTLSNDQFGRYPSWYCHKIIIKNSKTQEKQIFLINQWISAKPLEMLEPDEYKLKFKERFRQHLAKIYINWYQNQPLWGCWLYEDLNRLERSCIEFSFVMASVCLVACYFEATTMKTYEEERVVYNVLKFNIWKLFVLSIVCYMLYFLIKLIYSHMLRLHVAKYQSEKI